MTIKPFGYQTVLLNIALSGIYFLFAYLGLQFATPSGNVTLVCFPAGLALAVLLIGGFRYTVGLFLGAFAAASVNYTLLTALGMALGNTVAPLFAAWLLTNVLNIDVLLKQANDFLAILFFAAPLTALISTVFTISTLLHNKVLALDNWSSAALNDGLSNVLGIVLITPFILTWQQFPRCLADVQHKSKVQLILPIVLAVLAGQIIFLDAWHDSLSSVANPYLLYLFIIWVARVLGTKGVTLVLVMTAIQAMLGTKLGIGQFANDIVHGQLVNVFWYFLSLSTVAMTLATYLDEQHSKVAALNAGQECLQQLLQDIPAVAVQSFSADGIIHYWNTAAEQLYGYSSAEAIGQDIIQLLVPVKTQASYKAAIRQLFDSKQPLSSMELSLLDKQGNYLDVLSYHALVPHHPPLVFCIAINMTEYKRIEQLSRQNEDYLKNLLNSIPDPVWLKNKEGMYLFCNPMFERLLGVKAHEIIGKTDYDFVNVEQVNFFPVSDLTSMAKGSHCLSEESVTFADDQSTALLEVIKSPAYNQQGDLIGILGIARNITERKQMEEKLRASESRLRTIIDVSPVPMALSNKQHCITFLNPAFEKILGYSSHDLVNIEDWWQKAYPDKEYRELATLAWQSAVEKAANHKQAVPPMEFEVTCKSGETKTMLISASSVDETSDSNYLIVLYDISDYKKYDEALIRNQALLREREGYQRALLNNFPFSVWFKDLNYHFLAVNQAFAKSLGAKDSEALIGKSDFDFYPPEIAKQHQDDDFVVMQNQQRITNEEEHSDPMGMMTWTETYKAPVIDEDNKVIGMVGFSRDITERKNNETDLRIAATAFESQDGMFITDANRIILRVNRAFTMVTGYSAEEVIGQTPNLFSSDQQEDFYTELWDCIFASGAWQGEIWSQRKNGEVYLAWLMVTPVKDQDGVITHYVTVISDITVRKEAEEQIKQFAFYDSLTRLPNRRKLSERLEHAIAVARREKARFAVLMLDLDRFKIVNDNFGHLVGDELLQQVAERIGKRLRNTDTVARLGGDEFVVLLANITRKEDAARVAEILVEDIARPFSLSQGEVQIGTSIGISLYPEHGDLPEILMDNADVALYQAKNNGRGCYAYFTENLTLATRQRLQLETKLRRGLAQQELRVFYQPQIDTQTGNIIGAEALVRWQVFNELILPSHFIPIAEETSLIIDIGAWVLYETCHQGKLWLDAGLSPVVLSVNISSAQIKRSNLVGLVASALEQTGFPAQYLELEISERGLLGHNDADLILDILNKLHALGIRLAIDNFGTGYSSLTYLKRFPINTLKIDRSFVKAISQHQDNTGIASTIIDMAHSLGFKVLAEGVETQEQLEFLRARACDYYQGYIESKPLPANEFSELMQQHKHSSGA